MGLMKRAVIGGAGGLLGTVALSGFRQALSALGLVYETAPMQVVDRLSEVSKVQDLSPLARRALTVAAHLGYGAGAGAVFGMLREEKEDATSEASVGAALGVLIWGLGWAGWLPLLGVHRAPWTQRTPSVLLPVVDHAFFGAVWGLLYRRLRKRRG